MAEPNIGDGLHGGSPEWVFGTQQSPPVGGMILSMTGVRRLVLEGHSLDYLCGPGPWVDVKRFRPVNGKPIMPGEAVDALLADPEYRDHYCSPENVSVGGPLHGPYWADRITCEDFLDLPVSDCESLLQRWRQGWAAEDDTAAEQAQADAVIDKALTLIREAKDRRYLRNLRAEAEHDWGSVLGDFHEFVLVASDGTVQLLVASDD